MLTEEVADTALGLLLCTVREFPQAERFLRAGKWGAGAISAHARRRCATAPSAWSAWAASARRSRGGSTASRCRWSTTPAARGRTCPTAIIPKLIDMARDVDMLLVIMPGGPGDQASGQRRGARCARPGRHRHQHGARHGGGRAALIKALQEQDASMSAGLDVFVNEPEVPKELSRWITSCCSRISVRPRSHTRRKMDQLVVDNLLAWGAGKPPLTPVPETPWPPKKRA